MSRRTTALEMGVLVACFLFLSQHEVGRAENDGPAQSGTKAEAPKPALKVLKRGALPGKDADASPADRIQAALDSRVQINFEETPLSEVCRALGEQLKIPVILDFAAIDDMGIDPETPITCSMKDVRARSWLDFQLEWFDLTWMIRGEVLLVTTREQAECDLTTHVYDVTDLVGGPGCPPHDLDSLIEVITTCLQPTSWDNVGGAASIARLDTPEVQALVAMQTRQGHETIARLLADLRVYLPKSQGEQGESGPKPCSVQIPSGELKVRKTLQKKIDVEYLDTRLDKVLEDLGERLGIEIALDVCSLDDMGIGADTPMTFQVSDVSAASVLDLLLRPLELTFVVKDDFLVVLTEEAAEADLITRVYNVPDLVGIEHPDFDSLTAVIASTIDPSSWDEVGGPGSIAPYEGGGLRVLVVSQTSEVHQRIERVLDALRGVRHEVPPCMKRAQEMLRRGAKPKPAPSEAPQTPPCFGDPLPLPAGQPAQENGTGGMGGGFF